ncbi:MAG: flagellar motor switch protein FliG [Rickettsiaceae bacterium]|nr:flagellar motor switch protein FliG [Rickettsiaceae bacterium]
MAIKDINKLTGTQRVAIILLSLSEDNATKIFSYMNEDEITEISYAMSHLGAVDPKAIENVVIKMLSELTGGAEYHGNLHTTERLLEKVLDKDKVNNLMEEIKGPQGRNTWEKLANVNEELLALYFKNEHPQTAALVLSKLTPDHASKVLSNLPDDFAFEVISRILSLGTVKKESLERVERILRTEFISSIDKSQKYDSFEMLAEIFNNFDRSNESKFMGMLESNLPDAANQIREKMFTFDDLLKVSSKGVQRLLRDVEKSVLTMALKGASDELKKALFGSMSKRAAQIMEEDIQALGAVRIKDVDNARSEIVKIAKDLIDSGEIDVAMDNKDEFIT